MIESRIAKISYGEEEFKRAKPDYENALHKSGYKVKLEYSPEAYKSHKKNRSRNIIWFNPPFSNHVKTNSGKQFLKLVDKHFGKNHRLRKICNRNNLKLSYSCMPNMKSIIINHNKLILEND